MQQSNAAIFAEITRVSMPQAAKGCMQLDFDEALQKLPSFQCRKRQKGACNKEVSKVMKKQGYVSMPQAARGCMQRYDAYDAAEEKFVSMPQAAKGCMQPVESWVKSLPYRLVSMPQAAKGCMQLCVPEPLWDKP